MKTKTTFIFFMIVAYSLFSQDRGMYNAVTNERRIALLIGNSDYTGSNNDLGPQPVNDANDMASELKNLGFDVHNVIINGGKQVIETEIDAFSSILGNYEVGLFFYAGHGLSKEGNSYLVPTDFPESFTDSDIKYKSVDLGWIQEKLKDAGKSNHSNILIVDACRNEGRGLRSINGSGTRDFADDDWSPPKNLPAGMLTCFAVSNGQKPSNGENKRNGLYTGTLLKYINTPNISITDLMIRVKGEVVANNGQEPEESNKLTRPFYFVTQIKNVDSRQQSVSEVLLKINLELTEAENHFNNKRYSEAAIIYLKYKDSNLLSKTSMNFLGRMYDDGYGMTVNNTEAVKWYLKAAENGNEVAMYNLALMYKTGEGVVKDMSQYDAWIQKASALGYGEKNISIQNSAQMKNYIVKNYDKEFSNSDKVYNIVDQMPRFPGCEDGMDLIEKSNCSKQKLLNYIETTLKYPNAAMEKGIKGNVILTFVVEIDGKISNIEVLRDPGGGCGDEAKNIFIKMNEFVSPWIPGSLKGIPVRVKYSIAIKFDF